MKIFVYTVSILVCGTADNVLAQGYAMLDAEMGQPGFFAGAVEMLASVPVILEP